MKLITAGVKPFTLDDIQQALQQLGSPRMTVSEVEGFGQQPGNKELYRDAKPTKHQRPRPPQKGGDLGLYAAVRRTGILAF